MFCPKCRSEYMKGITECADCKVPLVEELGPKPPKEPILKLKMATLLAIFGISYTFAARTVGTFFPKIFTNLILARINVVLFFLSSLAVVFFFTAFYKEYVKKDRLWLKNGTILALTGSVLLLLTRVISFIYVFNIRELFIPQKTSELIGVNVTLILGICLLIFFTSFYKGLLEKEEKMLKKPLFLAVIGSCIFTLLQVLGWLNAYIFKFKLYPDLYRSNKWLLFGTGMLLISFCFFTNLYFWISFWLMQRRRQVEK